MKHWNFENIHRRLRTQNNQIISDHSLQHPIEIEHSLEFDQTKTKLHTTIENHTLRSGNVSTVETKAMN